MALAKETTTLAGVVVLIPPLFEDERGFFFESFSSESFRGATGLDVRFLQDNHSLSRRGVLRGLHYQLPPKAQGKLVRCSLGAVWDVAVDVMVGSPQLGSWYGLELSAQNRKQLWIPPGYAHGFVATTDHAEVQYKATESYAPELEASVRWSDPALDITWPRDSSLLVSDKDRRAPFLAEAPLIDIEGL